MRHTVVRVDYQLLTLCRLILLPLFDLVARAGTHREPHRRRQSANGNTGQQTTYWLKSVAKGRLRRQILKRNGNH
jgi:hypothetical protein